MYLRIRPIGSQVASTETWTISPAYRWQPFTATLTQPMLQSLANRMTANLGTAAFGTLRGLLSTSGIINGWRVEQWDEDDNLQASAEAFYGAPLAGTGTASKSLQDALVISLRTDTPGPRGRGRLYWPAWGASLTGWRLTGPAPAAAVADAKALLLGIQAQILAEAAANLISDVPELCVRSRTTHTSRKVTTLMVGDVLDTQRRRRDAMPEVRSAVAY